MRNSRVALREEVPVFEFNGKIRLGTDPQNSVTLSTSDPLHNLLFASLDGNLSWDDLMRRLNDEIPGRQQEASHLLRMLEQSNLIYCPTDEDYGDSPLDRMLRYFQVANLNSAVFKKSSLVNRLGSTSILVVGAGGIGSEVAVSLAMCGIGSLAIVDHDVVSSSNQNRSGVLSRTRMGLPKVSVIKEHIEREYPWCTVSAVHHQLVENEDVLDLVRGAFDCVVSAIDRPAGIHLSISDSCVRHRTPMIRGGYNSHYGAVDSMYIPSASSCFRCQERVAREDATSIQAKQLFGSRYIAASAPWMIAVLSGFMTEQIMAVITRSLPLVLINTHLTVNFSNLSVIKTPFEPPSSCEWCGGQAVAMTA